MMKWKKRDSNADRLPPPVAQPSNGWEVEGQEDSGSFPERRRSSAEINQFPVEPQTQVTIKTKTILPKPGDARRPTACKFVTKPTKTGMNTKAVYTVPGYFDPNTGFVDEIVGQEAANEMAYYDPNRRRSSGSIVNHLQGYLSALPKPGRAAQNGFERRSSDDSGYTEAFNGHLQPPPPRKPSHPYNHYSQPINYSVETQPNPYSNPSQATQTLQPPPPQFRPQQQTNPQNQAGYANERYSNRGPPISDSQSHHFHPQKNSHQNSDPIEHLKNEFNRLAENDGIRPQSLNFVQFLRILTKALGSQPDHETTSNIFRLMDTKRDGVIDFEEFSDVYRRLMGEEEKKTRRLSWKNLTDRTR